MTSGLDRHFAKMAGTKRRPKLLGGNLGLYGQASHSQRAKAKASDSLHGFKSDAKPTPPARISSGRSADPAARADLNEESHSHSQSESPSCPDHSRRRQLEQDNCKSRAHSQTELTLLQPTDHYEYSEEELSVNTTNTGNIRISRRARSKEGDDVQTKSIVKNYRLSRNQSRVIYDQDFDSASSKRRPKDQPFKLKTPGAPVATPYVHEPPPLEQTPLLLMRFTKKAGPKLVSLVEARLRKSGLIIYDRVEDTKEPHYTYLYLSAAQEALETFAEQTRWMKRTNDTRVVEHFTVTTKHKFVKKKKPNNLPSKPDRHRSRSRSRERDIALDESEVELEYQEEDYDPKLLGGDDLFTSNEWCHLAFRLLDSVEVWTNSNGSSKQLNLMLLLRDENSVPQPPPDAHVPPSTRAENFLRRNRRPSLTRQGSSQRRGMALGNQSVNQHSIPDRRSFRRQRSLAEISTPSNTSRRNLQPSTSFNEASTTDTNNNNNNNNASRRGGIKRENSTLLQRVSQHGKRSACLRHVLQQNDFVDVVTPLHWGPARKVIVNKTLNPTQLQPPVQEIRNYYGEAVAFYFAWMGFLSNWLVILGAVGALFAALRWIRNDALDEDEFTPMYGLFTFLWGVCFLRFWERHEHRLAYRWGTYSLSLYDRQRCLTTRPQFKGILRISPITGDYETYYPASKRRQQYAISALVTMFMLGVAFSCMILSLNLQGYIHPERNPERWHPNNPHPFHFPTLAILSERGYMFDAKHQWKAFLPSVLHVAMIFTLNNIYRGIAELLTEWENHQTEFSFRNSLIIKRFLFEAFDCYVGLFYLAFYERDVDRLHMELVTVFNIDTFRRLAMECFIPMFFQKVQKKLNSHNFVSEADEEMAKEKDQAEAIRAKATTANNHSREDEADEKPTSRDESTPETAGKSPDSVATASTCKSPESVATTSTLTTLSSDSETVEDKDKDKDESSTAKLAVAPKKDFKPSKLFQTAEEEEEEIRLEKARTLEIALQVMAYRPPTVEELAEEADLDEYDEFDDFMEIVIQFGYVTLFASAYPLASLVALVANWVEIRSDCFKLAKVCRRPRSVRADGIGVWRTLLSCIVWTSALTNCLIVGFTSDQMKEIFPAFYMQDSHGDTHLVHDKGWIAVFVIFGLERVMIILGLLLYAIIPAIPEDVEEEVERLQYIRNLEHEEVLKQVMLKRNNKKKN